MPALFNPDLKIINQTIDQVLTMAWEAGGEIGRRRSKRAMRFRFERQRRFLVSRNVLEQCGPFRCVLVQETRPKYSLSGGY